MTKPALIAPTELTELIRDALEAGDNEMALRYLPEATNRVLTTHLQRLPSTFRQQPDTTGSARWDTLIATAYAWALHTQGIPPTSWMTAPEPLEDEWLLDGDSEASTEWREWIRSQTPALFLAKRILLRERDLRTA